SQRRRVAHQHCELLATVAGEQILHPQRVRDRAGHLDQYLVARLMTVVIVERLEMVDVEQQQRQRLAMPHGEGKLTLQTVVEDTTIVRLRQCVPQCRLVHADDGLLLEGVLAGEACERALAEPQAYAVLERRR